MISNSHKNPTLLLVGQPNVGKSALFTELTGVYANVSNYPGTSLEVAEGSFTYKRRQFTLFDTPPIYGFTYGSVDENSTCQLIEKIKPDVILHVADAKNLKRDLLITLQLIEMNAPVILVLNMIDEAESRGIWIKTDKLSQLLGIKVVQTSVAERRGVPDLIKAIDEISSAKPETKITFPLPRPTPYYIRKIETIYPQVVFKEKIRSSALLIWLENATIHPVYGLFILLGVLALLYELAGKFGASVLVDFIRNKIFDNLITPYVVSWVKRIPFPLLGEMLVGHYGLYTMGIVYAFAILLPMIAVFYFAFGILEDSGYLPRLTVMTDKILRLIGLNGKATLPMVLGFGCVTMALLSTKTIESQKERFIAAFLLALTIPCGAKLSIMMGLFTLLPIQTFFFFIFFMTLNMIFNGYLASKVLTGEGSTFMLELPPFRMPQVRNLMKKTLNRLTWLLTEVIPAFLLGTFILFLMDKTALLSKIETLSTPLVSGWLGLPVKMTEVLLMTFFRSEYGAAGLMNIALSGSLDPIALLVSLVVLTLFIPCFASLVVLFKEFGIKFTTFAALFIPTYSILMGTLINYVFRHSTVIQKLFM
jgi:ferrous iron transport protein B